MPGVRALLVLARARWPRWPWQSAIKVGHCSLARQSQQFRCFPVLAGRARQATQPCKRVGCARAAPGSWQAVLVALTAAVGEAHVVVSVGVNAAHGGVALARAVAVTHALADGTAGLPWVPASTAGGKEGGWLGMGERAGWGAHKNGATWWRKVAVAAARQPPPSCSPSGRSLLRAICALRASCKGLLGDAAARFPAGLSSAQAHLERWGTPRARRPKTLLPTSWRAGARHMQPTAERSEARAREGPRPPHKTAPAACSPPRSCRAARRMPQLRSAGADKPP